MIFMIFSDIFNIKIARAVGDILVKKLYDKLQGSTVWCDLDGGQNEITLSLQD